MPALNLPALYRRLRWHAGGLAVIGFCGVQIPRAEAGFNFQTYQNNNSPDFVLLDSARSDSDIDLNPVLNSVVYQYFHNPIGYTQGNEGGGSLVSNLQGLHFAGEYYPWKKASVGLEMPLYQLRYYQKGTAFALGDMRLFAKINLSREVWSRGPSLSFTPSLYVPTGNGDLLLSNSNGGAGGTLMVEKKIGAVKGAVNLGANYFPNASFRNVRYDAQLYAGLGATLDLSTRWSAQIEWMGKQIRELRTGDLFAGGQYHFSSQQGLVFGASLASTSFNNDSLEYRLMLALRWSPSITKVITQHTNTKIETIQKFKTIHDCGPKPYSAKFTARPLTEGEKRRLQKARLLPYISTGAHRIETLKLGGKTSTTPQGVPYVKDAQTLFAVDLLNLPPRDTVISIKRLELSMTVNKLWSAGEEKTDMICLLGEKTCSGDQYGGAEMKENINFNFFNGKEPPNDFFMRQIAENTGADFRTVSTAKLNLPLAKLLENSIVSELMDLIYDNLASPNSGNSKTLYFAVAHDVYVAKNARLDVELSAESCAETNSKPTVETHQEESTSEEKPND